MLEGSEGTKTFTLKSGRRAKFLLTVVLSGEIESRTFVDPAVNGRDQSLLTPESVSDISRTIKLQQFFPAIGRMVGERIEVLDGSRRRAACIFNETKFEILVTKDEISWRMHASWPLISRQPANTPCANWVNASRLCMVRA